jgi:hypothetical protein
LRRVIAILTAMRLGDCDGESLRQGDDLQRYDLANQRNAAQDLPCSAEIYGAAVVGCRMKVRWLRIEEAWIRLTIRKPNLGAVEAESRFSRRAQD